MPPRISRTSLLLSMVVILLVAALGWFLLRDHGDGGKPAFQIAKIPGATPAAAAKSAPAAGLSAPGTPAVATSAATSGVAPPSASFRQRPFAATKSSEANEWTAEDGRDPNVIRELAHNEDEVRRMTEDNPRIKRRQLVYRKEPAWVLVERAKGTGQPVQRLTLPGLDGRELEIKVTRADLSPSGLSGTFTGQLPGREQSLVTLAFKHGREAFTVMSPEDGTFLQGDPREPGEVIVTSFDPEVYHSIPGGDPIKTSP